MNIATELGVPANLVLLETQARFTAENFTLTRQLLESRALQPTSAVIISRPYQQRRAFGICRKLWPELAITCASTTLALDEYVRVIGDADLVVNMMVGDAHRLATDEAANNTIPHDIPAEVLAAAQRLARGGFDRRVSSPHWRAAN